MYPKGTIYVQELGEFSGQKSLHAPLIVKLIYKFIQFVAAGVASAGILFVILFYGPLLREEAKYELGMSKLPHFDLAEAVQANETKMVQDMAATYGVDPSFGIVVPKIEAKSNVIANVDASDEAAYMEALESGVAHAAGTNFPGQGESIFLFSHSTNSPLNVARFNAVFYLLRKLEPGDQVLVFFADKLYEYEVDYKTITDNSDVSWLSHDFGTERLVMQTCDPPGTSINRMIITARLKKVVG
jgi:sortase A